MFGICCSRSFSFQETGQARKTEKQKNIKTDTHTHSLGTVNSDQAETGIEQNRIEQDRIEQNRIEQTRIEQNRLEQKRIEQNGINGIEQKRI